MPKQTYTESKLKSAVKPTKICFKQTARCGLAMICD